LLESPDRRDLRTARQLGCRLRPRIRAAKRRVAHAVTLVRLRLAKEFRMSAAALPLALAGTGYGLIGLLVIVLLIVLIVRLI